MQLYLKHMLCVFVFLSIISTGFGIKCFSCRSEYDPKCLDPFDNSTIVLSDCGMNARSSGLQGTMCRKTRQNVNGQWRNYFRDCAPVDGIGITRDQRGCYTKTGSDNIITEDCTCYDKDGCNSSFTFKPTSLLLVLMVLPALAVKMLL